MVGGVESEFSDQPWLEPSLAQAEQFIFIYLIFLTKSIDFNSTIKKFDWKFV